MGSLPARLESGFLLEGFAAAAAFVAAAAVWVLGCWEVLKDLQMTLCLS